MRTRASTFFARLAAAGRSRRGRVLLWSAAGLVALYAIVGFFVVPPILKHNLEAELSQALQRPVTIETVRVNPFAPSFTVRGLAVRERQADARFAAFEELYANVAWTSVLRLAPVIDELRLVGPRVSVVRESDGRYNFQDLLERPQPPRDEGAGVPRFALFNLQLVDGRIDFDDRAKGERHELTELRIGIPHLSSLPTHADVKVTPELSMKLNGAAFGLGGDTLPFDPARPTHLALNVDGFDLTRIASYLPIEPRARLASALLDTRLTLAFEQSASGPRLLLGGAAAIRDLGLRDAQDRPVLAWRRLGVELDEVEPLARRVHLKGVELDGADLHVRRSRSGGLNLAQLGPAAPVGVPHAAPAKPAEGPALSLSVGRVALELAKLRYTDETTAPAFDTVFEQARLHGSGLSTDAGKRSEWTLEARSGAGEAVKATAGVSLQPVAADGRVELAGARLERYQPYVAAAADLALEDGQADLALAFHWSLQQLKLDDIAIALRSARARVASEKTPFLRVGTLEVKGASFDLAARKVGLGEIVARDVAASLRRGEDGILNVARIARATRGQASSSGEAGPSSPWTIDLTRASLEGSSLGFEDRANGTPVKVSVAPLALAAEGLSTAPGQSGKVSLRATVDKTGSLVASGPLRLEPFSARLDLDLRRLALAPAQPYIDDVLHLAMTAGTLSAKGALTLDQPPARPLGVAYRGRVAVADFASVDKRSTQDLLKWKSLAFDGIDLDLGSKKLSLGEIALSDYYARIIVSAEGRLNLQDLVVRPEAPSQPGAADKAEAPRKAEGGEAPLRMRIAKVALKGGNVNFSDFYIKPNYSANLTGVGGSVTEMHPERAGDVDLRGRIDNAAPVEILGRVNPLADDLFLDMKASARDIELAPLSPYAVKYAGYGIARGKLSLNVAYHIEDRKLDAQNQVYLDQLTFGDPVESPTATKLPVTLALALLKDRNGVIDINLPISGSLDDPQFSIFGIIARVIGNLLVKAATSPFALLGAIMGGGEELSYLEFAPGSAALDGADESKLGGLAKALTERPGLKLEVTGRAAPQDDREGLRRAALAAKVRAQKFNDLRRAGKAPASADEVVVEPAEYEKYLRGAYGEEKFDKPRNAIGLAKSLPAAEMEALMLANAQVAEDDLRLLANARAQAAKEWLIGAGKIAADRVFIIAPRLSAEGIQDKGRPTRVDFSLK